MCIVFGWAFGEGITPGLYVPHLIIIVLTSSLRNAHIFAFFVILAHQHMIMTISIDENENSVNVL